MPQRTTVLADTPVQSSAATDTANPSPHSQINSDAQTLASSRDQEATLSESASQNDLVYVVDWDGPEDPHNPKNWPFSKKWAVTAVVSAYTFLSPLSSAMMAPASPRIAAQLGVTNNVEIALLTSIYVLGYALGPLILSPLSELFGRARVLQAANFWYLLWNFVCAFAHNKAEMLVFRLFSGLGGSGTLSVGGGVLGDVWRAEQRGKAVAVYSLMPMLGPVVGPICAGWISERGDWRWVFWAPTIVSLAVQAIGLFFLKETFAPVLLERKAAHIKKEMDSEKGKSCEVRTIYSGADREFKNIARKALIRPFMLFAKEPIIQLMGAYMAFVYGTMYLFLTTLPDIFEGIYGESTGVSGLNYIALGIGMTGVSQINAPLMDVVYKRLCARNGGVGKPEFRLPSMVPGTFLLPIGLFITGWTARASIHWIVPDIGILIVGAGMVLNFQTIQTYIIDSFTLHAASALAAATFFRSLAGFSFPLFAPAMYKALGYGKGDTILACAAIAIGMPAPFLFWIYGERIRNSSRYAAKQA